MATPFPDEEFARRWTAYAEKAAGLKDDYIWLARRMAQLAEEQHVQDPQLLATVGVMNRTADFLESGGKGGVEELFNLKPKLCLN